MSGSGCDWSGHAVSLARSGMRPVGGLNSPAGLDYPNTDRANGAR